MSNFIDFESYNLLGEERLAAAAIGGLYAMMVTGGISDCESLKEDFKNLTSKDDPTRINAEVVRKILTEALDQMDKAVDSWNPGSEMMKGAKKTLQRKLFCFFITKRSFSLATKYC